MTRDSKHRRGGEHATPAQINIVLVDPDLVSGQDIAHALGDADRIEDWLGAVRAQAMKLVMEGENVPGYKLVTRRIIRRWRNETAALRALRRVIRGSGFKQADLFERRLRSPAGLEKMFTALGRHAVEAVGVQVSISKNGVVLAPEGNPRAAAQPRPRLAHARHRAKSVPGTARQARVPRSTPPAAPPLSALPSPVPNVTTPARAVQRVCAS